MINADTKLYGIFGDPVGHSLSPAMHNATFQHFGINAVYMAFTVQKGMLALAFESIRSLNILGVNLTIPHKEDAFEWIDEIPEDIDREVGAINTVVNRDGLLYGYNTDVPGFLTALSEDLSFNPEGKTALVLGAGGAARAAVFALALARTSTIFIYNRTYERAHGLGEYTSERFTGLDIEAVREIKDITGHKVDLVVNSTSLGLKSSDEIPLDLSALSGKPCVYDMVYSKSKTPLLVQAESMGLAHTGGLGMLAAQGSKAFELWTGHKTEVREKMLETLKVC